MSTEDAEALVTRWEAAHGPPPDRTDPNAAKFWYRTDAWLRENAPGPTRPDESTLRLALTVCEDILASPGLQSMRAELKFSESSTEATFTEPDRRALRDLMVVLRKLDMRDHDVRLTRLYPIIERRGVHPDWKEGFEQARAAWVTARRDEAVMLRFEDPDIPRYREEDPPAWIRPREAFTLWVYGAVVHDDYAKELRWGRLGAMHQMGARLMAYDYAMVLVRQAAFLSRLIREGLAEPLDPGP
jgi:hypothetical protein